MSHISKQRQVGSLQRQVALFLFSKAKNTSKPVISDIRHEVSWGVIEPGQVSGWYEHIMITTNEGFFVDFKGGLKV